MRIVTRGASAEEAAYICHEMTHHVDSLHKDVSECIAGLAS